jgi:Zn-dependent protease
MQGSFKLGTLAGIDIRLHATWLVALFLIAWSPASGYFPIDRQSAGSITIWGLSVVGALMLFALVLVHEPGHSPVVRARGPRVDNITLLSLCCRLVRQLPSR